jgi:hypothetical protein
MSSYDSEVLGFSAQKIDSPAGHLSYLTRLRARWVSAPRGLPDSGLVVR